MGNSLILLFSFLLFQGSSSFAGEERFEINESVFTLNFDDSWRATEGLFGLPLVLSGPIENKSRPIISVTPTPIEQAEFDHEKLKNDQADYERERKDWVANKNGQIKTFDKMKKVSFGDSNGYRVGFSYNINGKNFSEASYYLVCNKRLYHLKYLLKEEQAKHRREIQDIIGSFECH